MNPGKCSVRSWDARLEIVESYIWEKNKEWEWPNPNLSSSPEEPKVVPGAGTAS